MRFYFFLPPVCDSSFFKYLDPVNLEDLTAINKRGGARSYSVTCDWAFFKNSVFCGKAENKTMICDIDLFYGFISM